MKSLLSEPAAPATSVNIAWRVLALVNLFRLLVPLMLAALFVTITPTPVGQAHPALFLGSCASYFLYAAISINSVKRRWPDIDVQTVLNVAIDVLALSLLTYASGGMNSGLAALLLLPIGAASFVVRQRLALMFAAVAALAILVQQALTTLATRGDT